MTIQNSEEHSQQTNGATEVLDDTAPKPKTAFFITPLGSIDSEIRRATDGVIEAVIRPVLAKHSIFLTPPHEILNPGNITKQIIGQILNADLVLANLTGLNANVMYELAVRHAVRKPIIVIAENGTKLPFDIAAERTVFYNNDMAGAVQLTKELDKIIPKALGDKHPDNPIYSGLEASLIQELTKKDNNPVESYIVEKLGQVDELTSLVKNFINSQGGTSRQVLFDKRPVQETRCTIEFVRLPEFSEENFINRLKTISRGVKHIDFIEGFYIGNPTIICNFVLPGEISKEDLKVFSSVLSPNTLDISVKYLY